MVMNAKQVLFVLFVIVLFGFSIYNSITNKWKDDYQCTKYERYSEGTCNPDVVSNCTFTRDEKETQIETCFCVSDNSTFERKCVEQISIRRYKK